MSIKDYRTDHLLLLVGANPLPNLVAARLLLRPGGVVHLIHSSETAAVAARLQKYLGRESDVRLVEPVKETQAGDILRKVDTCVSQLKGTVGLHYTGGTKAMAVHAYRAVEETAERLSLRPVFSYLDATDFFLRIDPDRHEKVLGSVKPTLEELVMLHGCRLSPGAPEREEAVVLPEVARTLAETGQAGVEAWRDWCDSTLRARTRRGGEWKSKTQLRNLTLPLPPADCLRDVVRLLKDQLGLPEDSSVLPLDPAKLRWPFRKQKPKYLCRWLDGIWLEHYVLMTIVSISERAEIHDWGMGLQTDRSRSSFNFEFDVAALRGYQFFGISCTTDESFAKSKLFEAHFRARQLGGDHARTGLLSGSTRVRRLERELTRSWDTEGKVEVLGPQHLPDLGTHLTRWFKTAT